MPAKRYYLDLRRGDGTTTIIISETDYLRRYWAADAIVDEHPDATAILRDDQGNVDYEWGVAS